MTDRTYKEHTGKIIKNITKVLHRNTNMETWEIANALDQLVKNDEFIEKIATGNVNDLIIEKRTVYEII